MRPALLRQRVVLRVVASLVLTAVVLLAAPADGHAEDPAEVAAAAQRAAEEQAAERAAAAQAAAEEQAAAERAAEERLEEERRERAVREEQRTVALTERLAKAKADVQRSERALLSALAERNRAQGDAVIARFDADDARQRLAGSRRVVRDAERAARRAARDLDDEREALAKQIGLAYRSGSTARNGQMVAVDALLRTKSPNEFVNGMTYLDSVLAGGAERVEAAERTVVAANAAVEAAAKARVDAADAVEAAEAAVAEAEALVPAREQRFEAALQSHVAVGAEIAQVAAAERTATEAGEEHPAREANVRLTEKLAEQGEKATDLVANVRAGAARIAAGSAGVAPWRELACPVDDAHFVNDWGFPRTGGRSHEGTDVFADRGTPIVAMADALVRKVSRADVGLGGLTVTYEIDGYRIYNAHLDEVAEHIEVGVALEAGEVIGTVGTSGNAKGTPPHNHMGISLSDGTPMNPYPLLRRACG